MANGITLTADPNKGSAQEGGRKKSLLKITGRVNQFAK